MQYMTDISLITSLYQSEQFLLQFSDHAVQVAQRVAAHGITLEFVFVPNDASPTEREQLSHLIRNLNAIAEISTQVIHVPRESLYASWNRGVEASNGKIFGFWNVDDVRKADALVEAHILAASDAYDLFDFPYDVHFVQEDTHEIRSKSYQQHPLTHKTLLGTFFMATRSLYEPVGGFDTDFRVAGDREWSARPAVREARFINAKQIGGIFSVHNTALSQMQTRRIIEDNIIFLRYGAYHYVRKIDPEPMRVAWETWGQSGGYTIPDNVADWLWGADATRIYDRYVWERQLPPLVRRGLLSLARRGLAYSVDWEINHGKYRLKLP